MNNKNWHNLTVAQQQRAIDFLAANGWEYHIDTWDPRAEYRGWWVHPEHRPRPTGDSTKMHYAAEIAFNLGGYDVSDLPSTLEKVYA